MKRIAPLRAERARPVTPDQRGERLILAGQMFFRRTNRAGVNRHIETAGGPRDPSGPPSCLFFAVAAALGIEAGVDRVAFGVHGALALHAGVAVREVVMASRGML